MAKDTILNSALSKIYKSIQLEEAARKLKKIQQAAEAQNWPADVTAAIHVEPEGNGLKAMASANKRTDVLNREYGEPGSSPSPVIRSVLWELE